MAKTDPNLRIIRMIRNTVVLKWISIGALAILGLHLHGLSMQRKVLARTDEKEGLGSWRKEMDG